MVDAQELVGVENEKPVGGGDQGLLLGMVERRRAAVSAPPL
jgi:hypothetical protein